MGHVVGVAPFAVDEAAEVALAETLAAVEDGHLLLVGLRRHAQEEAPGAAEEELEDGEPVAFMAEAEHHHDDDGEQEEE